MRGGEKSPLSFFRRALNNSPGREFDTYYPYGKNISKNIEKNT